MKHLILQDHNLSYMVYFRPNDKPKLYRTIFLSQQRYWQQENNPLELLNYITLDLNKNGFKVVDISQEIKQAVYIRSDFNEESFVYKGVRVRVNQFGYTFRTKEKIHSCKDIDLVFMVIDKECE